MVSRRPSLWRLLCYRDAHEWPATCSDTIPGSEHSRFRKGNSNYAFNNYGCIRRYALCCRTDDHIMSADSPGNCGHTGAGRPCHVNRTIQQHGNQRDRHAGPGTQPRRHPGPLDYDYGAHDFRENEVRRKEETVTFRPRSLSIRLRGKMGIPGRKTTPSKVTQVRSSPDRSLTIAVR